MAKKWWEKFMLSRARQVWGWSPARKEALRKALVGPNRWRCAKCGTMVGPKERDVDHQIPAVDPIKGQTTWDDYLTRLLDAPADTLSVLCKPCHKEKTSAENKTRRRPKAKSKKIQR